MARSFERNKLLRESALNCSNEASQHSSGVFRETMGKRNKLVGQARLQIAEGSGKPRAAVSFTVSASGPTRPAASLSRGPRYGAVATALAPYQSELGSIPGGVTPKFPHVGIAPIDGAGRRVFSGISRFPRPCIPALLHSHVTSLSSGIKTSLLRAAKISPPHFVIRLGGEASQSAVSANPIYVMYVELTILHDMIKLALHKLRNEFDTSIGRRLEEYDRWQEDTMRRIPSKELRNVEIVNLSSDWDVAARAAMQEQVAGCVARAVTLAQVARRHVDSGDSRLRRLRRVLFPRESGAMRFVLRRYPSHAHEEIKEADTATGVRSGKGCPWREAGHSRTVPQDTHSSITIISDLGMRLRAAASRCDRAWDESVMNTKGHSINNWNGCCALKGRNCYATVLRFMYLNSTHALLQFHSRGMWLVQQHSRCITRVCVRHFPWIHYSLRVLQRLTTDNRNNSCTSHRIPVWSSRTDKTSHAKGQFDMSGKASMEQRPNTTAGETGDLRENPPTSGDSIPTCKIRPGIETGSPWREASRLTARPPRPGVWLCAASKLGLLYVHCTVDCSENAIARWGRSEGENNRDKTVHNATKDDECTASNSILLFHFSTVDNTVITAIMEVDPGGGGVVQLVQRPDCLPPTKTNGIRIPAASHGVFACGKRGGRYRWLADPLGDFFSPPLHLAAAPTKTSAWSRLLGDATPVRCVEAGSGAPLSCLASAPHKRAVKVSPPSSSVSHPLVHSRHEQHLARRRPAISCRLPHFTLLARRLASVKDCRPLGCGSIYSVLGRHLDLLQLARCAEEGRSASQSHQNILASWLNVSETLADERRSVTPASLAAVGIRRFPRRRVTVREHIDLGMGGGARWVTSYAAGQPSLRQLQHVTLSYMHRLIIVYYEPSSVAGAVGVVRAVRTANMCPQHKETTEDTHIIIDLYNKKKLYSQIADIVGRNRATVQTRVYLAPVYDRLFNRTRVPRKKSHIGKQNQNKILACAQYYLHKDTNFWDTVLSTDESELNVFHHYGRKVVCFRTCKILSNMAAVSYGLEVHVCLGSRSDMHTRECGPDSHSLFRSTAACKNTVNSAAPDLSDRSQETREVFTARRGRRTCSRSASDGVWAEQIPAATRLQELHRTAPQGTDHYYSRHFGPEKVPAYLLRPAFTITFPETTYSPHYCTLPFNFTGYTVVWSSRTAPQGTDHYYSQHFGPEKVPAYILRPAFTITFPETTYSPHYCTLSFQLHGVHCGVVKSDGAQIYRLRPTFPNSGNRSERDHCGGRGNRTMKYGPLSWLL
ncbi:hypothetical protein PR048_018902 [Dryococelus australis]|uniref:Uncharacterized protein n=1 Tax=Dryococelus australis TaxID=614101 RepID=A0ABQ9H1Z2_9NEOP|nr:hypothetical protein PR048_018902 [Dryococelus australis]